jgi:hypothetical protein
VGSTGGEQRELSEVGEIRERDAKIQLLSRRLQSLEEVYSKLLQEQGEATLDSDTHG